MIAEKSAISFVRTSVPFLVFQNSKVSLMMPLRCFCNCMRFVAEVRMMGGGLPALFVGSCSLLLDSLLSSSSTSVLRGARKYPIGNSSCGHICGSGTLLLITAVFFRMVACLSEGFCYVSIACEIPQLVRKGLWISQWMAAYRCSMLVKSALP